MTAALIAQHSPDHTIIGASCNMRDWNIRSTVSIISAYTFVLTSIFGSLIYLGCFRQIANNIDADKPTEESSM